MYAQTQTLADQAVYILQMRSRDAIKYIRKNSGCSTETAESALKSALTFKRKAK